MDAKARLRNGEDMIMKYGITAQYFVTKQIHWRVANGQNLRNFAPRTSRTQITKVTAVSVCSVGAAKYRILPSGYDF